MSRAIDATLLEIRPGATLRERGVAFCVWAPHADAVSVVGDFNAWKPDADPLERDDAGFWRGIVEAASAGDEYRFHLSAGGKEFTRIDPYARVVTNSIGNSIVWDPAFEWEDDAFVLPPKNELVIYELHVGTFHRPDPETVGTFDDVVAKFPHLQALGINAIEIMPSQEFAGDLSWGYNPAQPFAVESSYGGPNGLKRLVKEAHRCGIAVIMDVVYNHFGPSDLDLWQFDGWSENGKGGIYFYNDQRAETPWGSTRPDYGREEVRNYLRDNALMWLEEYRMDGLRYDMTLYIRSIDGSDDSRLAEGWHLTAWMNQTIHEKFPGRIAIAEDLRNNAYITKAPSDGGAGFDSQWDAQFVHPVRAAVIELDDARRSMSALRDAVSARYDEDAFNRVVYSESHDEVANGKARVPQEISPDEPDSWFARKRSGLASVLTMTAPGIPMLFQAQEMLRDQWFQDTRPVDWSAARKYHGIVRFYRDLIRLRRSSEGTTRGLLGQHLDVYRVDEEAKVLAFRRWDAGGPGDDTLVVCNFANREHELFRVGAPAAGVWKVRFNSDWRGYSQDYDNLPALEFTAEEKSWDGQPCSFELPLAAYGALIFSQDANTTPSPPRS